MPDLRRTAILALAFALATYAVGWWSVPVLGAVWGVVTPGGGRAGRTAALAAAAGWVLLLGWIGVRGPVLAVADVVGRILALPAPVLIAVTLLLPAALAGSAATLAGGWRRGGQAPADR